MTVFCSSCRWYVPGGPPEFHFEQPDACLSLTRVIKTLRHDRAFRALVLSKTDIKNKDNNCREYERMAPLVGPLARFVRLLIEERKYDNVVIE